MAGEKVIEAFLNKKAKKEGNTMTYACGLYLFGNRIAEWRSDGIWITNAGWFSVTTKDRLCKLGANVSQRKGVWYLFGQEWNGGWVNLTQLQTKKQIYEYNR